MELKSLELKDDIIHLLEEIEKRGPLSFYQVTKLFGKEKASKLWFDSKAYGLTDNYHNLIPPQYQPRRTALGRSGYRASKRNYRLAITEQGCYFLRQKQSEKGTFQSSKS